MIVHKTFNRTYIHLTFAEMLKENKSQRYLSRTWILLSNSIFSRDVSNFSAGHFQEAAIFPSYLLMFQHISGIFPARHSSKCWKKINLRDICPFVQKMNHMNLNISAFLLAALNISAFLLAALRILLSNFSFKAQKISKLRAFVRVNLKVHFEQR